MSICSTLWLVAHLWTYHAQDTVGYNNENFGAGIHCELTDRAMVSTGYFRNSYERDSFYLAFGYSFENQIVNIRPFFGIASGYKITKNTPIGSSAAPFIGGVEFYKENKNWQYGVTVTPDIGIDGSSKLYPVFHLTVSYRFWSNK